MMIGLMLVSAVAGGYASLLLQQMPKWQEAKIQRLIQKKFQLSRNEYALEYDRGNNRYVVTTMCHEYGVKLSTKSPIKIVSVEEY